jgi:hypothetical protein
MEGNEKRNLTALDEYINKVYVLVLLLIPHLFYQNRI